jgi:hypothetical protein
VDLTSAWTEEPDCLAVQFSGPYSLAAILRAIDQVRDEANHRHRKRVRIDVTAIDVEELPMLDRYYMGIHAAEVWSARIKVAVIAQARIINKFGETVAVNRGARVAVFSDSAEAMAWLLEGVPAKL